MTIQNKKAHPNTKKNKPIETGIPFSDLIIASFVINATIIALVFALKKHLPPQVPLFYGLPKTSEQIVNANKLIIPSVAAAVILLLNVLLAQMLKDGFLKKALILTGIVGSLFSAITTFKIIFLVGSF